jgi:hypothetical protein
VVFKGSGFYRTDSRDAGKGSSSVPSGSESSSNSTSTEKSAQHRLRQAREFVQLRPAPRSPRLTTPAKAAAV